MTGRCEVRQHACHGLVDGLWAGRDPDISHRDYRLMHAYLSGPKKVSKTPTHQHHQHPTDHREHRTVALLRAYSTLLNNGSRFWYYLPLHRTQGPGAHADLSDIPRSFCHLVHSSLLSRLLSLSRAASLNDGEKHSSSYSSSIAGWIVQQQ